MSRGYTSIFRRAFTIIPLSVAILLIAGYGYSSYGQVVINEVMASNGSTLADEDGDYEDWIELYNAGPDTVSLYLHGLSDSYDQPFIWIFPDTSIAPGSFMLVWASGKNRSAAGRPLHTGFSISADGEEIILTSPTGIRLDEIPPTPIPRDISYGRYPDGTDNWFFFPDPSPNDPNSGSGFLGLLPDVVFSEAGGFFSEPFNLSFSPTGRGATIRYTTDGSEPDENSLLYNGPMLIQDRSDQPNNLSTIRTAIPGDPWAEPASEIFKGTVVRARIMREGYLPGNITTHTYFVHPGAESRYSLPVISISSDSVNFFSDETGIYVPGVNYNGIHYQSSNYYLRGDEWERPVHLELFENGTKVYSTNAGARIHGGASRRYPLKSLRLYARSDYGDSRFNYPFFPESNYSAYNRLILRNSGNDLPMSMFRDGFIQTLVRHLNFDTQAYRPSILFLNGEYWGIRNIRERYDRHYLARVHSVDPDRVDILTLQSIVKEGSNSHYLAMTDYIGQNNIAEPEHYNHVSRMMDIDNFIDYTISNIFIRNTDWPGNNIDFWRYQADSIAGPDHHSHDGRWRWLMYDTDFGFGRFESGDVIYTHNTLAFATEAGNTDWPNPDWSTFLLRNLLTSETFRTRFINRFSDLMNTTFLPQRVLEMIDRKSTRIEPYMPEHIHRAAHPSSMTRWYHFIDRMKEFSINRPEYQRNHIIEQFDLPGTYNVSVDVNNRAMGSVQVNTLHIVAGEDGIPDDPYPWTGIYFTGVPIEVNATPSAGYRFVKWAETVETSASITVEPDNDITLTAVFDIDEEYSIFPNPHNLSAEPYFFNSWSADAEAGTYPGNMAFYYMDESDPGPEALPSDITSGAYNHNSGTRINGLADGGLSFLNTTGAAVNPGYPANRLGAAVLSLNTVGMEQIRVSFTAGTLEPGSLVYNLRLQYQVGIDGPLLDVAGADGEPVEYRRRGIAGHSQTIGPVTLPETVENLPLIRLWWKYYHTGEHLNSANDDRTRLRLDNIIVEGSVITSLDSETGVPDSYILYQNYPNPFNPVTTIRFDLPEPAFVQISVFNLVGQKVAELAGGNLPAGSHHVDFDASALASGVYIYRLETPVYTRTRKMMLLK